MALDPWRLERPEPRPRFRRELLALRTDDAVEYVDITEQVRACVRRSGITEGLVNVQTRHTTTAIVINENEPGLLQDLSDLLARMAPREARYNHDELAARPTPVPADEPLNGHAHLRSLLLAPSATLNIVGGRVELGRWQRVFFVELDGGRKREVAVGVSGLSWESPRRTDRGATG